ncbi:MAG TPA: hypothetical protein VI873_03810 [Candidatus Peribacteraceae bacterium]|nr:hypothetical protein [Candidatus Peribacteraceae bacterium]
MVSGTIERGNLGQEGSDDRAVREQLFAEMEENPYILEGLMMLVRENNRGLKHASCAAQSSLERHLEFDQKPD